MDRALRQSLPIFSYANLLRLSNHLCICVTVKVYRHSKYIFLDNLYSNTDCLV